MIVHVILYEPKADLPTETRDRILGGLAHAARTIPSIRRLRLGRRVKHGRPGYEQMMRQDFAYAVLVEFDNVDGLLAYLSHPAHGALGDHFTSSAENALAYDYELLDAAPTGTADA